MKRNNRYYTDPVFRAAMDRELTRATEEAKQGGWITYAIHDPTTPDTVGAFNTMIIYVGQSKQFGIRVDDRLKTAGRAVKRPTDRIDGALWDVMNRGRIPRFRVIERMPDAISSFVSETNWAKEYLQQGYPLRNKWTEQKFGGRLIDRYTVPHEWLWRLAVEDALEARFNLILKNETKGNEVPLDLSLFRPKELLRKVRKFTLQRALDLGHEATVRIAVE